jgi:uncharacterized protein
MVALFSEQDEHHQRCSDALTALTPPLFTCWPVVTEAAWLVRKRPETLHRLFKSIDGGLFALLTLDVDDLPAVAALMKRYESCGLQLADAALAHLAGREGVRTVFTTDRRDFSIIRLKRNRTLRLIPDIQ